MRGFPYPNSALIHHPCIPRYWATKGNVVAMTSAEAILSSAASMAVGFHEDTTPEVLKSKTKETINLIACVTQTGKGGNIGM